MAQTDTKPDITFHSEYQVQTMFPKSLMALSVLNTVNLRVTRDGSNVALIAPIGSTHRCHVGLFIMSAPAETANPGEFGCSTTAPTTTS